jgi:hypothetical protein
VPPANDAGRFLGIRQENVDQASRLVTSLNDAQNSVVQNIAANHPDHPD